MLMEPDEYTSQERALTENASSNATPATANCT